MKDNFSNQASSYSKFRPGYPQVLFDFILTYVKQKQAAWDCGTGNGQVATELAKYFEHVYATDISSKQLENAVLKPNIYYKQEQAEKTEFEDNQFDLVVVAQAIHWFDFDLFYKEVTRTLKPDGLFAAIGYHLCSSDAETDAVIQTFYKHTIGAYWDRERKYIDDRYQSIPFPFKELTAPEFVSEYDWSVEQLAGYLGTWSAVQHFITQNGYNPVDSLLPELKKSWGDTKVKRIKFPVILRLGIR